MKQILALVLILFLAGCAAQTPPAQPAAQTQPEATAAPVAQATAEPTAAPQPVATAAPVEEEFAPGPMTAKDPIILKQGNFHKVVHSTSGKVQIIRSPGGAMTVNLIGFDTTPGPGLALVLHSGNVQNGYVVSSLTSASGNYPYNLPANFDVRPYTRAAIYNKKYNVIYGEADLT
jgi:hypothetical protein